VGGVEVGGEVLGLVAVEDDVPSGGEEEVGSFVFDRGDVFGVFPILATVFTKFTFRSMSRGISGRVARAEFFVGKEGNVFLGLGGHFCKGEEVVDFRVCFVATGDGGGGPEDGAEVVEAG
jgi:hypothetical protein